MMKLSVFFLSSALALSAALPVEALPLAKPSVGVSDVQEVRDRYERRDYRRDYRYDRRDYRRVYRRGYYNGYHGSNYYRDGYYRHSDGWWYPLAAFGAGAIIGGAIASQPPAYVDGNGGINPRHVEWCMNRYRTYRSYDNTYVPRAGVRAQCYSPYY